MMPFRVAEKTALDRFRAWAKKRFWAPRAFKKTAHKTGGMQGIYLPFWTYDADLYTSYTGQGGRDRTEVRTRRVNGKTRNLYRHRDRLVPHFGRRYPCISTMRPSAPPARWICPSSAASARSA